MLRDHQEFLAAFLPGEERAITRTGVQVHRLDYWSDHLEPFVGRGKRTLVTWDPRDITYVFVRTPGGPLVKAILTTPGVSRMSLAEWEARRRWERTIAKDPALRRQADESLLRAHETVEQAKQSRRIRRRQATAAAGDPFYTPVASSPIAPPPPTDEPTGPWLCDNTELFDVEETTYDF